MRYKSCQQPFFASFSPYILLFGHKPKLPTLIWQDVMTIINLDDQNIWTSSMWIVNNLIPTCNANGYGKFGNQSTPKHMSICHYSKRWLSAMNPWIWNTGGFYLYATNNNNYIGCDYKMWYFACMKGATFLVCCCWRSKMVKHGRITCNCVIFLMWTIKLNHP